MDAEYILRIYIHTIMDKHNSLYHILHVDRSASDEDIKRSYKKLCVQHHPDKGGDEQHFQRITEAYNILKDPQKRRLYDLHGMEAIRGGATHGSNPMNAEMMHSMMNDIFGSGRPNPFFPHSAGQPTQSPQQQSRVLQISLKDAMLGNKEFVLAHTRKILHPQRRPQVCNLCKGEGKRVMTTQMGFMSVANEVQCPQCRGACYSNLEECLVASQESLRIVVPKHSMDNEMIVVPGKGDEHPKHPTADLILRIQITPHETIKRVSGSATHLYTTVHLSMIEALRGFRRTFQHADGQIHHVRFDKPVYSSMGMLFPRMPMGGLLDKHTNQRGHLFFIPVVQWSGEGEENRVPPPQQRSTDDDHFCRRLAESLLQAADTSNKEREEKSATTASDGARIHLDHITMKPEQVLQWWCVHSSSKAPPAPPSRGGDSCAQQ